MNVTTKTTYNRDYNEYRVRLFVDGVYQAGADYYTDDKEDAKNTATSMEQTGKESDKASPVAYLEQIEYALETGGFYDVCNDYSLDIAVTAPNMASYTIKPHGPGLILEHTEYKEIHYYVGKPGLQGKILL